MLGVLGRIYVVLYSCTECLVSVKYLLIPCKDLSVSRMYKMFDSRKNVYCAVHDV
jgi:hypothetical protein